MIFQNTTATVSVTIICSSASERGRSSSPSPRLPSRISLMLSVLTLHGQGSRPTSQMAGFEFEVEVKV